jgi:hypothetical protein
MSNIVSDLPGAIDPYFPEEDPDDNDGLEPSTTRRRTKPKRHQEELMRFRRLLGVGVRVQNHGRFESTGWSDHTLSRANFVEAGGSSATGAF